MAKRAALFVKGKHVTSGEVLFVCPNYVVFIDGDKETTHNADFSKSGNFLTWYDVDDK